MHTGSTGRQSNIRERVDQQTSSSARCTDLFDRSLGQDLQFARGQVLLTQLNEVDRTTRGLGDSLQQPFAAVALGSGVLGAVGDVVEKHRVVASGQWLSARDGSFAQPLRTIH